MIIGFQYWRFGIGGAERVTLELINRFLGMGYSVVLYTDEPERPGDLSLPPNVERVIVPTDQDNRSEFWKNEAQSRGVHLVIYGTWLSPNAPLDCQAIHDSGMKLVYSVHGSASYPFDKDNGIQLLSVVKKCARLADAIVCLSDVDALYWSVFCNNVVTVANPVADYLGGIVFSARKQKGATVVWVGRFDPVEKRPDLAIKAFARLVQKIPHAHLIMVGGDNEEVRAELEILAKKLNVYNQIQFTGSVSNPEPYLKQADLFLMTSPTEGFPLALCEAMHEGLPCVMFDMPHLVLSHNCSGIIQVPWGDIDAMGLALSKVLTLTSEKYEEMSACVLEQYRQICEVDISKQWSTVVSMALTGRKATSDSKDLRLIYSFFNAYERLANARNAEKQELELLCKEIAVLKNDNKKIVNEITRIKQSYAFRIGSAVLWLPRSIRKLLRTFKKV